MAAQQAISAARLQEKVGRTLEVLIDTVTEEGATARSRGDAPDIDGQVYLDPAPEGVELHPGDRVQVLIDEADDYDLYGRWVAG
jgi:ribosomal protein S12 methylthiotransferase